VSEALLGAGLSPCDQVTVELLEGNKLVLLVIVNGVVTEFKNGVVLTDEMMEVTRVATVEVGINTPGAARLGALLLEIWTASEDWVTGMT
jgi:hypothetical protein